MMTKINKKRRRFAWASLASTRDFCWIYSSEKLFVPNNLGCCKPQTALPADKAKNQFVY